MLGAGEPVPGNGRKRLGTDEEEDEAGTRELDGQSGNQDSEVADEKEDGNQDSEVADEKEDGNQDSEVAEEKEDGNQDSEVADEKEDGNQDPEVADEKEDGNQENNNEEEDKKEEGKTEEEAEEGKQEGLDEGGEEEEPGRDQLGETDEDPNGEEEEEEHRQNAGSGNNVNHQNSEQNESRNQESEGDEDGENDENQEENDDNEQERRRRRAAGKGKRPMSCKLEPIVPEFSEEFEEGESSNTPEDQTNSDIAIDDHRDLGILGSMWNYKYNNGNIPHPPSDELLKYVMDSIPNFKLLKEFLKMKIMEFESNFKDIIQMDGDNPEMTRPIDRETFELCKRLWGNQQQRQSGNQQQRLRGNQQQRLRGNQLQTAHFCLIHYQQGDDLTIYLIIFR